MNQPEIKAVLFDLDGTLLPMDTDAFVESYVKLLAKEIAHVIEPEKFVKALWSATHSMIGDTNPDKSNEQVFEEAFLSLIALKKEDIWPILDEFYVKSFPKLVQFTQPNQLGRQVVEEVLAQNKKVAIATNPLFPKVAIMERLKWASLEDMPFHHVTFYENSFFTKPHTDYYLNICKTLDLEPEQCLMVGNDMQEDMVASKIGMKTFLIKDHLIDRGNHSFQPDWQGSMNDFYQWLKQG